MQSVCAGLLFILFCTFCCETRYHVACHVNVDPSARVHGQPLGRTSWRAIWGSRSKTCVAKLLVVQPVSIGSITTRRYTFLNMDVPYWSCKAIICPAPISSGSVPANKPGPPVRQRHRRRMLGFVPVTSAFCISQAS